ncbi:MAG: response regulator [Oligoflexia bacterium]|nr:response regulator [Oligoflexia bacterium]MBF0367194.1 response regulator [Oligoflexia bacterium]
MNKIKVLIVDDEELVQQVVYDYFEERFSGSEITTASNGLEALQLTQNTRFDIIVVDYTMPIMDGLALIKSIREQKNLNHETPLILLSSYAEDVRKNVEKYQNIYLLDKVAFQSGVDAIINKLIVA